MSKLTTSTSYTENTNNHMDSENDNHMAGLSGQHIQHSVSSQMVWPFFLTSFPLGW